MLKILDMVADMLTLPARHSNVLSEVVYRLNAYLEVH